MSKLDYLTDIGVWPIRQTIDPTGWLTNFEVRERPFAINLLNVFSYFNERLVDALMRGAFKQTSQEIWKSSNSSLDATVRWQKFLDSVLVTFVEGEFPNPTDSGILFARKARQVLGIEESQIMSPRKALEQRRECPSLPILFVDDFIGSGNQMFETWVRPYNMGSGQDYTFSSASADGAEILYAPLISTKCGMGRLARECPKLRLYPAHIVDKTYSLTSPLSNLWDKHLKPDALDFLETASKRAGIVDALGAEWDGFENFALSLAFYHSVPDATLPLYYWNRCGWKPLIQRA